MGLLLLFYCQAAINSIVFHCQEAIAFTGSYIIRSIFTRSSFYRANNRCRIGHTTCSPRYNLYKPYGILYNLLLYLGSQQNSSPRFLILGLLCQNFPHKHHLLLLNLVQYEYWLTMLSSNRKL